MIYRVRGLVRIDVRTSLGGRRLLEGPAFDDCEVTATVPAPTLGATPLSVANAGRIVLYDVMALTQLPCWWLRGPEVTTEDSAL